MINIESRKVTTHKRPIQIGRYKSKGSMACVDTGQQELTLAYLHLSAGGDLGAVYLASKRETLTPKPYRDLLVDSVRLGLRPVVGSG